MSYPIVQLACKLLASAAVGLFILLAPNLAGKVHASDLRTLSFVVEPFEKDTREPPTNDQIRSAQHALEHLEERARELEIEGHTETTDFTKATVLVQVTSNVSARGLRVHVRIYDKSTDAWHSAPDELIDLASPQGTVKVDLVRKTLPATIVRLLELANTPQHRQVMFANCLYADQESAKNVQQTARLLSSSYPHSLSAKDRLKERFRIVRLVPTAEPRFYRWWCMDTEGARRRGIRDDTFWVHGFIEQTGRDGKTELFLVFGRRGNPQTANITVDDDSKITLERIANKVEALANDN